MVIGVGTMAAMTALQLGSQALGNYQGRKDQRRYRDSIRSRRGTPQGIAMQESLQRMAELTKTMPGQFKAGMTSRAQSAAQNRRQRLNRSLARSGFTAGSEVAQRGQRGMVQDLIASRADIGMQAGQLEAGLNAKNFQLQQQADQYFNPADTTETPYVDPFQTLMPLAYMGMRGGSTPNAQSPHTGTPMASAGAYNPVPFASDSGALQLPGLTAGAHDYGGVENLPSQLVGPVFPRSQ